MMDFIGNFAHGATVVMGLNPQSKLGSSMSFFIEDSIEIFTLIYLSFFFVYIFKNSINPEKIKKHLSEKNSFYGYFLALFFGTITPFCLCSSIPIFLGLVAAGIPFGVGMTFLLSAPLTNKIAALMLIATPNAGVKIALIYLLISSIISLLGGWLSDLLHLEKYLDKQPNQIMPKCHCDHCEHKEIKSTIIHSNRYTWDTIKDISLYVLLGLIIGAIIQGYVPQEFFLKYFGKNNFFAVPFAAISGIPIYANHNNAIPLIQVLFMKGVPVGTAIVALMSISILSVPELVIFGKILKLRILSFFIGFLILSFIIAGYLLNAIM